MSKQTKKISQPLPCPSLAVLAELQKPMSNDVEVLQSQLKQATDAIEHLHATIRVLKHWVISPSIVKNIVGSEEAINKAFEMSHSL
jgi:hypothetical protein